MKLDSTTEMILGFKRETVQMDFLHNLMQWHVWWRTLEIIATAKFEFNVYVICLGSINNILVFAVFKLNSMCVGGIYVYDFVVLAMMCLAPASGSSRFCAIRIAARLINSIYECLAVELRV